MPGLLSMDFIRNGAAVALAVTSAVAAFYVATSRQSSKGSSLRSLPGPKRAFLIGNMKNFPRKSWTDTFTKWWDDMGDLIYAEIAGRPLLILSSLEDAEELLVRRATVWSGRAENRLVNELMGFSWSLLQTQPGPDFNELRKIIRRVLGPQSVDDYDPLMEQEAETLVARLKDFSGDPTDMIFGSVGAVMIKLAYGEKVFREHGQELVKLNTESLEFMAWCFQQIWLPNLIPITRFLPSWVPGVQFPNYVTRGREMFSGMRHFAFDLVKKNVDQGKADFSVISKHLNEDGTSPVHLRDSVAVIYMGGVDTTGSALLSFFSYMLLNPDVQRRVHLEIDEATGGRGTLTLSEIKSLSYLKAVWKESLRMTPPLSTGVRHVSTSDDVFKGYFIPKGTIVIAHIAFMLRDPRIWGDDADVFKPERFLPEFNPRAKEYPDVESVAFGFGRRICPGKHIADRNAIVFIAKVLENYEILPLEGEDLPTKLEWTDGILRRPLNLKYRFIPRH
ncbi:cytochrome P450 [Serendipita vermifera]|nr:cytochrome P450 [Serendipita vermifera]